MIKILRKFKTSIALILYFILLVPTAFAAGIGDVVTDVSNNLVTPAYDFGTEDVTGLNIQMHMASGKYGSGIGALSVVGPVDSNGMKALLTRVVDVAGQTGVKTTPLKGGEVREYSMSNGIGLTVQLPDYLITVEIYESGNSASADMQTAKILAQKLLDGLEKNGLLKQAAPKISEDSNLNKKQNQSSSNTEYKDKVLIGEPKDKGIVILNTDNTAGVSNGPTASNIFKIDKPHLLTYIRNYHWNNGKGATPGTISLKDQNGKIYGPWQAQGTPGMGGISNANWEVSPKIILPEGTYTIIDSDPKTWSTNAQSGGRGMGQVHVTPNYTTSNNEDFSNLNKQAQETGGVGAIGNIPGPDSVTEAIVGVAVPGIIATALSALSGISTGGLGGFTPPPTGTSNIRLSSSNSVPSSQRTTSTTNISDINVLGRKRREDESFVAEDKQTIINSEVNTKIALNINDSNQTIKIDTSAFDFSEKENLDTVEIKTVEPNISKDGFNKDGFNKDGFNKDGFNKDGFNKDGFNKDGFNKDGFNKDGFNKDGFNKDGFNKDGFNKDGFNKDGLNKDGFNKDGFNKDGFNKDGFNKDGFNKDGFNKDGFNKDGFNKDGFNKDGFNKDGFNKDGFNKDGLNKDGFNKDGLNKDGLNKDGFNKDGFNKDGFNKDGFNKDGFNKDGFNKDGFNKDGFNKDGFNKDGFNKDGFNKDGFNKDGFNKDGLNKDGFNKDGLNKDGFNKDGFNKDGFNKDGFNKDGFNKDGFNKDGLNKDGFNKDGFNKDGFNKDGLNKDGLNKDGFNKDGLNKDGFNKDGFNKDGFNKDGFNKDGFNKDGFNKDGFNKDDLAQGKGKKTSTTTTEKPNANKEQLKENNEYDEFGYNKNGFNKDGYDRDGYDLEGFDYKGYNRSGFDPWGYNKQGYSKDGYHWTGFNKDGYNKMGRHWSENPAEGDSPFNVDTRNPFDGGPVVIGEWKPTKPALGEPYPRTLEKYGAKPWTNESTEEKSAGQIPNDSKEHSISNTKENTSKDSDIIGPEDPMNTLKNHGINKEKHPESIPEENSINSDAVKNDDIGNDTGDNVSNTNSPKDGEKKVLTGATDGRSIEIEYNSKTGEWVNTENGNIVDPDKFEKWQTDLAEDKKRILEDIEKMSKRTDSNSKAIDENLSQWKKIEQMQKTAEKYGIGEKGGPGDVGKAIQDLKNDMLDNKSIDQEKLAKINKVIDSRIKGETIADNGERWTEVPWYKDIDSALKANTETAKNIVTGQDSEGNTSWGGIIGRTAIGLATGGSSEYIMTVAEALSRVKDGINNNESGTKATLKAIGMVIAEEGLSKVLEGVGSIGADEFARRFPVLTKKLGDAIENGLVKINAVDQELSKKLGLIKNSGVGEGSNILSKQGATANNNLVNNSKDNIPKQGADKIDDLNVSPVKDSMERTDVINTTEEKIIKLDKNDINTKNKPDELTSKNNPDTEMSKSKDTLTQQEIAVQKKIESKIEDFDKIPKEKQTEIIKKQAEYEEYKMQAEEKVWKLSDKKIKNHEDITVDDILDLKADPAAMRILKDVDKVDGIKGDLGSEGAKKLRMEFNEAIDSKVHQPSYREVEGQLSSKYGEVRLETVRTPEAKAPWDVNTDNDVVALRKVTNPDGTEEWVEIPRDEWEKLYYKAYGDRTGYSPEQAAQKFPCVDWNKLDDAGKVQKWAELHGENATDVYHPEAARDFNTQRTAILKGNAPDCATARQAALGQRELLDAEAFGMMEKYKVNHYWEKGDIVNKTEALEQLRKAGNQIKNIEQGYKNMGYKISDMSSNMEKGLDIINDRSLAPDTRAELLKGLGYDTPGDFVNKLTSRLSSLKIAKK